MKSSRSAVSMILCVAICLVACLVVRPALEPCFARGIDVIVVFEEHFRTGEHAGDIDLGAQRVMADGELLWNEGTRSATVASAEYLETSVVAMPDGSGGAFVVYQAEARTGEHAGDQEILAQRIDANGEMLWNDGERSTFVALSTNMESNPVIVPDGAGGFIVVFEEHLRGGEDAGDVNIAAQRVSADGELLWNGGERSSIVSSGAYLERNPAALPDGAGGVFVVFEAEARTGEHAGDSEILGQRLDAGGRMMWNNGERSMIIASSRWSEKRPVLVPDGAGGAIALFEQHCLTGEYAGDIDIGAQRFTKDGEILWEGAERSVDVASGASLERLPVAIPDGEGGVIAVFEAELRSGEHAGDCEILAQRIDANGKLMWNEGERSSFVASSQWSEKRPVVLSDGVGGAIAVFEQHCRSGEYAGDIDIGAQRISPAGELMWEAGQQSANVSSGEYLERLPQAIPDGDGGVIVVFEAEARSGEYVGDCEIAAQRLDADGKMVWYEGDRSRFVASSAVREMAPVVVSGSQR